MSVQLLWVLWREDHVGEGKSSVAGAVCNSRGGDLSRGSQFYLFDIYASGGTVWFL